MNYLSHYVRSNLTPSRTEMFQKVGWFFFKVVINGDIRIAVQKTIPRWISVLRVVNKETYAVLSRKICGKFDIYEVGIGEN